MVTPARELVSQVTQTMGQRGSPLNLVKNSKGMKALLLSNPNARCDEYLVTLASCVKQESVTSEVSDLKAVY